MARYIDADKIVYWVRYVSSNGLDSDVKRVAFSDEIARMPAADVVSKEVFEQVKWERDTALKTLEEHGIGLGQKADDVVEVVRCRDCEHFSKKANKSYNGHFCEVALDYMKPDDFCSYGKREEDINNG